MIKPTVGRVVLFFGSPADVARAAIIAAVHTDSEVNLCVISKEGTTHGYPNAPLVQADETPPNDMPYCTWMPYQVQVAKTYGDIKEGIAAEVQAAFAEMQDALDGIHARLDMVENAGADLGAEAKVETYSLPDSADTSEPAAGDTANDSH